MCKLGDKTVKKNEAEIETDMAREEVQVSKIRELIKERNIKRGETSRIKQKPPATKRRSWMKTPMKMGKKSQEAHKISQGKKRERMTWSWSHSQQRGEKYTMT